MMDLSDLKPGAIVVLRDGREAVFVDYDEDGGLGCDTPEKEGVSWWAPDGHWDCDEYGVMIEESDADIVGVKENTLF